MTPEEAQAQKDASAESEAKYQAMLLDQLYPPSESDAEADEEHAARAQASIEAENKC